MLVFVGAVRHPQNSTSYDNVEKFLRRTLLSICRQTNTEFRVIVVCNRIPAFADDLIKRYVSFVHVNFEAPSLAKSATTEPDAIRKDRSTKYVVGILAAQQYQPNHIMIFDTDDYISPHVSEFTRNPMQKHRTGWYGEYGYIIDHKLERQLWRIKKFYKVCGTSLIIRNDLLMQPDPNRSISLSIDGREVSIDSSSTRLCDLPKNNLSQNVILQMLDNNFLFNILGRHKWVADYFDLTALPFPIAIWNWNLGENHGGERIMDSDWAYFLNESKYPDEEWVEQYLF